MLIKWLDIVVSMSSQSIWLVTIKEVENVKICVEFGKEIDLIKKYILTRKIEGLDPI